MKKKLMLRKETLRTLSGASLRGAHGGILTSGCNPEPISDDCTQNKACEVYCKLISTSCGTTPELIGTPLATCAAETMFALEELEPPEGAGAVDLAFPFQLAEWSKHENTRYLPHVS